MLSVEEFMMPKSLSAPEVKWEIIGGASLPGVEDVLRFADRLDERFGSDEVVLTPEMADEVAVIATVKREIGDEWQPWHELVRLVVEHGAIRVWVDW